jgi:putative transposase
METKRSTSTCWPRRHGVAVWSCCLMPNHVHMVAVPSHEDGLSRTFRDVHRSYTG